jgi:O-antigen/teichoic acid export membrane protein
MAKRARGLSAIHKAVKRRPGLAGIPSLYRNTAGTIGVSLASQVALLASGVAAARILGVEDRGHSALLLIIGTAVSQIGTFGLPLAVTFEIAREPGIAHRLMRSLRGVIVRQVAIMVLAHAVVLVALFHGSEGYVQRAAAISLASTPAWVAWQYSLAVLQGAQQFRSFNVARLVFPPMYALSLIALLASGAHGLTLVTAVWVGLIWVANAITISMARNGARRAASGGRSDAALPPRERMYRFGLKAMLGSISPMETFQLDQAIVGLFVSPAALGVYAAAVAFTNLPRFVAQSIGLVAYPHVAASPGRGARRSIARFAILTVALCGVIVAVIELALPTLVPLLFGHAFDSAVGVARILLISAVVVGLRRVLGDCARGAGRPALGTVAELASLVALLPLAALFIGDDARGVAWALVCAAAVGLMIAIVGLLVAARPARDSPDAEAAPEDAFARVLPPVTEASGSLD